MGAEDLYQQLIVEHSKRPRNAALPEGARTAEGFNRLCGDRVKVGVVVDGELLTAVGCEAKACAICVAAASTMSEAVAGRPVAAARSMAELFGRYIDGDEESTGVEDLDAFAGVRRYPSRRRCATLPWEALTAALPSVDSER